AVQVGNRSKPGTSSAARVGRKAQCHPNSSIRTTAAAASSTTSTGERPPGTKSGKATICMASAAIATSQASRSFGDLIPFINSNTFIETYHLGYTGQARGRNISALPQATWGHPPSAVRASDARQGGQLSNCASFSSGLVSDLGNQKSAPLRRTPEAGCPHMVVAGFSDSTAQPQLAAPAFRLP